MKKIVGIDLSLTGNSKDFILTFDEKLLLEIIKK
jgi:hypothetical protein